MGARHDFPTAEARRILEPGPIVLLSSAWEGRCNIMAAGWHTMMEFQPALVGCVIAESSHSFRMIRESRECVINVPGSDLAEKVAGIGSTSGASLDKFAEFGLTPERADEVDAPSSPSASPVSSAGSTMHVWSRATTSSSSRS